MECIIRIATEDDINAIAQNVVTMAMEGSNKELSPDTVHKGVTSLFKKPELGFYIVAEIGNKNVGSLVVLNEWSDWNNGIRWWIHSVYVSKNHRQQGIYKKMYEFVKNKAQNSDAIIALNLSVNVNNRKAQAAYERVGMSKIDDIIYTANDIAKK